MKALIIFFLLSLSINAQDSTEIKFESVENTEQRLANQLNNIKIITISCNDTTMRGKTFKLITTEYKNGELVKTDDYGMTCEDKEDKFEMNGESYVHVTNICNSIRFKEEESEYKIRIALKQESDSSKFIIQYSGLGMMPTYFSNKKFDLRIALSKTGEKYIVPVGESIPILTYNPPYEIDGGEMLWYCILDTENPGKWYDDYQIEHFYIISLLVE
ncbi:MAG: hypothetical protein CVV25_11700 [Ignavibacteriae bacterium HGW-Ignavibacteriae-4]|jgi:hypothetical protein|nr:MAG: hypothetical protein CVV25_11700 [Ignavibacteriae bacterium HGW-Ignavibacteriae-4]